MKYLLVLLGIFLFLNTSFAQGSWEYYGETYIRGSISGTITRGYIFKTNSREYFVVNERTRQRVRTRNPEVIILKRGSDYKLIIEDFDEHVICKKLANVVETRIDGEFNGWDGETIFNMMNGQIWKQSNYAYQYHYAYMPDVLIYEFNGSWVMKVEGVDETINVTQLNSRHLQNQGVNNQYNEVINLLKGASIIAQDDGRTYLGSLTNKLNSNSIFNEIGTYGSVNSSNSIWNNIGTFGSKISSYSPFNNISSTPPMIVKDGEIIGYLTVNNTIYGGISPELLKAFKDEF